MCPSLKSETVRLYTDVYGEVLLYIRGRWSEQGDRFRGRENSSVAISRTLAKPLQHDSYIFLKDEKNSFSGPSYHQNHPRTALLHKRSSVKSAVMCASLYTQREERLPCLQGTSYYGTSVFP